MKKILILLCCMLCVGCSSKVKTIDAEKAYKMMEEEVVVIDVRTKSEYNTAHIKGAINIPLDSIREKNSKLPSKETTILVYCQSGNRSRQAASKLVDLGYTKVYDFGGINDWPYGTVSTNV